MLFSRLSKNSAAVSMAGGKIKVRVISATKLKNKERFQTSDPYCMIECEKESKKTKSLESNLNPTWNEEFVITMMDGEETLGFSIWDKNTLSKDNFMGYSYASVTDCPKDVETEKVWLDRKLTGELMILLVTDEPSVADTWGLGVAAAP